MDVPPAADVMRAMVAMFASGDPSEAAKVVAADYLDHQGLGAGPMRGVNGFAQVVRPNHASYEHQEITIEDLFAADDRAVARSGGGGVGATATVLTTKRSTSFGCSMAEPWSTAALTPEPQWPFRGTRPDKGSGDRGAHLRSGGGRRTRPRPAWMKPEPWRAKGTASMLWDAPGRSVRSGIDRAALRSTDPLLSVCNARLVVCSLTLDPGYDYP